MAQSKIFCRTLCENYLAGDKWKYIVTLDEAWVYLNDCNIKGLFIIENKEGKKYKPGSVNAKKISVRNFL